MGQEHEMGRTIILRFIDVADNVGTVRFREPNESVMFTGTLMKLWQHGMSALKLCEEPILEKYPNHRDIASIGVIARAAIESAGTFKYIFYGGLDEDHKRFLLDYLEMCGLMLRISITPLTEEAKAKQEGDRIQIAKLKAALQEYNYFQELKKKAQSNSSMGRKRDVSETVLKGKWKPLDKSRFPVILGFGPLALQMYYPYLSDYVHNGYIAALQTSQPEKSRERAEAALTPISATLALITELLAEHIAETRVFLDQNRGLKTAVDVYTRIARMDIDSYTALVKGDYTR